jgi:hypothetical protein
MDIIRELEHIKADIRDLNHSLEIPTGSGSVHDRLHDIESALDHETAEMDTSLVLSPDGAGGVAWGAGGAGDMLKSVYDTDDDGVVDNSEAVGGASLTDIQDEIDGDITAHAGDADAHHDRLHDIDSAADHNGMLGVPIRMDIHGIPMDAGFKMDDGRLMGYNA